MISMSQISGRIQGRTRNPNEVGRRLSQRKSLRRTFGRNRTHSLPETCKAKKMVRLRIAARSRMERKAKMRMIARLLLLLTPDSAQSSLTLGSRREIKLSLEEASNR